MLGRAYVSSGTTALFRLCLALSVFIASGCVQEAQVDGRPCPCEAGYLCCLPTQRCVPEAQCKSGDVNACGPTPVANGQMIANMEVGSTEVTGGDVHGSWFPYSDNDAGVGDVSQLRDALPAPVCGSSFALHVQANGFSKWGSGIGFALKSTSGKNAPFDASAHGGLRFWMKSARDPLAVNELQPVHFDLYDDHNADAVTGCALTDSCINDFTVQTPAANSWKAYSVPFSQLADGGTLDLAMLYTVQWTMPAVDPGTSYDFWLDDVAWLDE
ncbi:MAG TPA: hypothetical protein VGI10_28730 [Polyangiaceae bacterium]|jgi:hypothetical protein